jgi:hypothetical protein
MENKDVPVIELVHPDHRESSRILDEMMMKLKNKDLYKQLMAFELMSIDEWINVEDKKNLSLISMKTK